MTAQWTKVRPNRTENVGRFLTRALRAHGLTTTEQVEALSAEDFSAFLRTQNLGCNVIDQAHTAKEVVWL